MRGSRPVPSPSSRTECLLRRSHSPILETDGQTEEQLKTVAEKAEAVRRGLQRNCAGLCPRRQDDPNGRK